MMSESRVMRLGDKSKWREHMESMAETVDQECFLEHVWPGEWQKSYATIDEAFFACAESMTPAQFCKELRESGCRDE